LTNNKNAVIIVNVKMKIKRKEKNILKSKTKAESVQNWLPYENISENGIIKMKNGKYIKILKIIPINYNLKSDLEKESILNSYKNFLKICNFDIQILIQSKKENLSKHISSVKNQEKTEDTNIKKISNNYINFLNDLIQNKKTATKDYYILLNSTKDKNDLTSNNTVDELTDRYLQIKDSLSRCGNKIIDISNKKQVTEILFSFLCKNKREEDNE